LPTDCRQKPFCITGKVSVFTHYFLVNGKVRMTRAELDISGADRTQWIDQQTDLDREG